MEGIREVTEGQTCEGDINHRVGERRPGEETNKWEEAPETPGEAFCQVWRALWWLVQPLRLSHRGSVYMQRYRLEHARPSQLTHTLDSFCFRVKWYARSHQQLPEDSSCFCSLMVS